MKTLVEPSDEDYRRYYLYRIVNILDRLSGPELRWSHRTHWLRSHPAQPDPEELWTDEETGEPVHMCHECGYFVYLTREWRRWRT